MHNVFVAPMVPGVISSQVARALPQVPKDSKDWQSLHKKHVSRLKSAFGSVFSQFHLDAVVIHSGSSPLRYSRDDQHWPVTRTPSFIHWTPYVETPALLVVQPDATPILYCERHSSYWEGPAPKSDFWDVESFRVEWVDDLANVKCPHTSAFIGDDMKFGLQLGFRPEQCNRQDLMIVIESFRTLKSEFEVASMRAANEIAARGHRKLRDLFLSGDYSELDLHHAYLQETSQTDFSVPYSNIVALGANCGILHHIHYETTKRSGDLSLLVDAGAQVNGYASDITRTWTRGAGAAAKSFGSFIQKLDVVQQALVSNFKIGKPYEELHNESHEMLAGVMIESELARGSKEELVKSGLTRAFFPHGLGHSLGIQVHDVGMKFTRPASENPYLRNTSTITAGQVVTVEPGFYLIPTLVNEALRGAHSKSINAALVKEWMPFGGIRIEDNILATEVGSVNLTRDLI